MPRDLMEKSLTEYNASTPIKVAYLGNDKTYPDPDDIAMNLTKIFIDDDGRLNAAGSVADTAAGETLRKLLNEGNPMIRTSAQIAVDGNQVIQKYIIRRLYIEDKPRCSGTGSLSD